MCDAFVGTWKLTSSENFDDYMKEVGKKLCCGVTGFIPFSLGEEGLLLLLFILEVLAR